MTKEFCKLSLAMLMCGTILCSGISKANAQTCSTPPSCEALGYTKAKDDCKGIQSLQCPFDTSKYYCFSVAELPPEYNAQGEIAIGAILYSDGTIYKSLKPGKEPIAVVFDVENRLAVGMKWFTKISYSLPVNVPGLDKATDSNLSCSYTCSKISYCNDTLNTCTIDPTGRPDADRYKNKMCYIREVDIKQATLTGTPIDGRNNTRILTDYCKAKNMPYTPITAINSYKTAGTNPGQWHIPSITELATIIHNKDILGPVLTNFSENLFAYDRFTSSTAGSSYFMSLPKNNNSCNSTKPITDNNLPTKVNGTLNAAEFSGAILPVIKF